ncbi:MAG: carboxypeptidase [Bacteroidetes bacterium]|nr:MAG: carboxypeptidase [Bacteroidota bacterium]
MPTYPLYEEYVSKMRKIADVKHAMAVLQWDEETYLPPDGASIRGQQMATLSEISHELFVDQKLGNLLNELRSENGLVEKEKKNVELTSEDYNKNKKYESSFVRKLSETTSRAYHAWISARRKQSFDEFAKPLSDLVDLKRQESDILGYKSHPYDAHLNEFEKGATVAWLDSVFKEITVPLKELLDKITTAKQVDDQFLNQHFDKDAQWKFGLEILKDMGFNFESGRQDISEHPFTTSFNSKDVRITTRINEKNFTGMTWSCIHEGGHALYEQGLSIDEYGLPAGEACSLGIHESQSRLWENNIGRSRAFISLILPKLQHYFPQLNGIEVDALFKAINKVSPSLIRTEADELTYHFHVMIRYELEKELIAGNLQTNDIPAYWNDAYQRYLGVKAPNDASGCLQDIHWSHGSFGYFPTYSLGSFYAAQFYSVMEKENKSLEIEIQQGDFAFVNRWLKSNVYNAGRLVTSTELCNKITMEPLNLRYFIEYLETKYTQVYGLR